MPLPAFAAPAAARAASIFAGLTFRLVLLAVIALLLVNTYADIRVPLPLLPDIHYEGWKPKALRFKRTIDEFDEAQEQALLAAQAAKERAEKNYRDLAERIDDAAQEARVGHMDAAERFIAANRVVCPSNRGATGRPAAPAGDNRARDGEGAGGTPLVDAGLVAVPEGDVRICTVNTLQAEAGRAWALELEAASR